MAHDIEYSWRFFAIRLVSCQLHYFSVRNNAIWTELQVLVSLSLFSSISRIFESGSGLFENWILPCVPLCEHSFLLELGKLPPVMDACENLPHQNKCQSNGNNSSYDTKNNSHDINNNRTFFSLLDPNLKFSCFISVPIYECESTIIIINKSAESLIILHQLFGLLNNLRFLWA